MDTCPNCGSSVRGSRSTCDECGASLDRGGVGRGEQPGDGRRDRQRAGGRPQRQQSQGRQPQQSRRRQDRPGDDGLSRRALLAGGGIAVAAAAGGWFFILQDDGDVSGPDSPGESFDSAPAVSAGRDEPYEINNGEDHYFAVELDSGDQLEVTIEFEHQEGDLDMDLYDPSQTIRDSSISVSDDETGSLTAPESGTHYINPYGYAGASNTYELVVQIGE